MRKAVAAMVIVGLALIGSAPSWGQAYLDRGLGDTGSFQNWSEVQLPDQLIGVSGRLGVGARVANYCPKNSQVANATAYEGQVAYAVNSSLLTVLSAGYVNPRIRDSVASKAKETYLNLTFELRGDISPVFGVYFGFGPSLFFTDYRIPGARDWSESVCGGNLALGMDFFLTQCLAVNIDAKYMASFSSSRKVTVTGAEESLPTLDGALIGAGLRFFF